MGFKMFRWPWKKEKPVDGRAARVAFLVGQISRAKELQRIVQSGIKLGGRVVMTVEANDYVMGVVVSGSDPVLEFLVNWAAGSRYSYEGELEELEISMQADADRADSGDYLSGDGWDANDRQGLN